MKKLTEVGLNWNKTESQHCTQFSCVSLAREVKAVPNIQPLRLMCWVLVT